MILRDEKNYIHYKTLRNCIYLFIYLFILLYEYSKPFVQPVIQPVCTTGCAIFMHKS